MNPKVFSTTLQVVLTAIFVVLGLLFLFAIRDIVLLLFIALIIASSLNPFVDYMEKFSAPRWLVVLAFYLVVFAVFGVVVWGLIPVIFIQLREFALNLPNLLVQAIAAFNLEDVVSEVDIWFTLTELVKSFPDRLVDTPTSIIRFGASVFGGLMSFFTLIIFSYYLLLEHNKLHAKIASLFPHKSREMVHNMLQKVELKLGAWMRGQLLLMLVVGVTSWIGLTALQVEFALSLAIIAGILEIVPIIGPIVATVPAVIVAVTQSPWHAVAVIVLYIFVQQLEQALFVPRIMQSAVGLDPLVVILAIMIGGRLGGTMGALLAIPVTVVLIILWKEYQQFTAQPTSKE